MNVAMISDIHCRRYLINKLRNKKDIDLLLVAGDLTNTGTQKELENILNLINGLEIKHKVIILGNHDGNNPYNLSGNGIKNYKWCKLNYPNIHFLNNEFVQIDGLRIYGSPYTEKYWHWDFFYIEENQSDLTLPKINADIIITHEPPMSSLSYDIDFKKQLGNKKLLEYLQGSKNKCKLLACGHIHNPLERSENINGTMCYNVSTDVYYTQI